MSGLHGRGELGPRIEPKSLHRLAIKLGFARWSAEVTMSKRKKRFCFFWLGTGNWHLATEIQPHLPLPLQPLARNAIQPGIARPQRAVHHLVDAFVEALVLEAHPLGQSPKHFYIRTALPQRIDRLIRHLQMVVPVGRYQILMLEERGC